MSVLLKQTSIRRAHSEAYWAKRIFLGLSVVVVFLYGYSLAWSKMGQYATRRFRTEIKKITLKFNLPIEYGKVRFSTGGIIVEEFRIGKEAPIIISEVRFQVDLLPWSENFAKLSLLSIRDVKIKTPVSSLQELGKLLPKKNNITESPSDDQQSKSRFLDQVIAASPATVLEVLSAGVVLLSDKGNQLLALKGLKLTLDKKEKRLLFVIDRVRRADGPLDGYLQGRFELNPERNQEDYRFFIRRKAGPSDKNNLWSISGMIAKDLSSWTMDGKFRSIPTFFGNSMDGILGKNPKIALKTHIEANKIIRPLGHVTGGSKTRGTSPLPESLWQLDIAVDSSQTFLDSKIISTRTIGPILFKMEAKAQVDPVLGLLSIQQGKILLPIADDAASVQKSDEIEMGFNLTAQKSLAQDAPSISIKGTWNLPETNCQSLIKAMPPHLIPLPQEFKLDGTTSAQVSFDYDSKEADLSQVQLTRSSWNCQVLDAPYDMSQESLAGPFEMQPKINLKEDEALESQLSIRISPENPHFASVSTVPKNVIQAFVSAEDASFYSHQGIETQALIGAFRKNIAEGRVAVGGSTITMQTVKNLFLSHERTLSRKLQEIFLAWHLEKSLTKDRIMEIYLNIIEFGPGIYGIGHAARHFFDKDAQSLSLHEAVYLANTLPNPKMRYASFCQGALTPGMNQLMNSLLKRMHSLGYISQDDIQQTLVSNLRFNDQKRIVDNECQERTTTAKGDLEEKKRL
jgi:hypothetical protein